MNKYFKQYQWANIKAMLRNSKIPPKECLEDFKGRLVVITGVTSGIGYETARLYASHGANLLVINRNEEKSIQFCQEIRRDFGVECDYKIADFAKLANIKKVAQELLELDQIIDVFIHNAGVFSTKKIFTEDDNELVFQVDHLGAFVLNYILKEKLKQQGKTRILLVNSEGHRFAMTGLKLDDMKWIKHRHSANASYGEAKTAQLLTMLKFAEYFEGSGVTINAVHPGDVKSNMGENNGKLYRFFKHHFINPGLKSPEISAKSLYYLGVSKEMEGINGKFYNKTTEEEPAPPALDREVADQVWDLSIQMSVLSQP